MQSRHTRFSLASVFIVIASLGMAWVANADPGHALRDATAKHLFTSPYHLTILTCFGAALWLGGHFIVRRWPRRLLQGTGLGALTAAAVIWGAHF